jgi:hypothetical protein
VSFIVVEIANSHLRISCHQHSISTTLVMVSTAITYPWRHNRKKLMSLCLIALALVVPMLHWHSQNTGNIFERFMTRLVQICSADVVTCEARLLFPSSQFVSQNRWNFHGLDPWIFPYSYPLSLYHFLKVCQFLQVCTCGFPM